MSNLSISNHQATHIALWKEDEPWQTPSQGVDVCPCKHQRLRALPREAFVSLLDDRGVVILERRDADRQQEKELRPSLPNEPLPGTNRRLPPLKWQREALTHYIEACLQAEFGDGAAVEVFYSGGRALQLVLGREGYPKLCDTDTKLFVSGAPVEALHYITSVVEGFIRHLLSEHFSHCALGCPSEWVSRYFSKKPLIMIDPAKGLYRASITLGGNEDWLIILDQDTGRLHSVTGKSIILSQTSPLLIALEGTGEDAWHSARCGLIKTATPQELEGLACLSGLELMTHGWAYPQQDVVLAHAFIACIAARCQASPWLWSKYCKSHRSGWDHIGSITFLLAGFFAVAVDTCLSYEDRSKLLSQVVENIKNCLHQGSIAIREASLFLEALATDIVSHQGEHDLIAAEVIFLMSLCPHSDHLSGRGLRLAIEGEKAQVSSHQGLSFLLIPRRSQKFPDRCYLPVLDDLDAAWNLLLASRISSHRGSVLWEHLTSPLTVEGVRELRDLVMGKEYHALMKRLLGDAFSDREFFALFAEKERSHMTLKAAIKRIADSYNKVLIATENRGVEHAHIEIKLIALQILLTNRGSLSALSEKAIPQLTQWLGVAYTWGKKERKALLKVISYLLEGLGKSGCSVPDISQLWEGLDRTTYVCNYYIACDSCDKTAHLPAIHYKEVILDQCVWGTELASTLLEIVHRMENKRLFEAIWSVSRVQDPALSVKVTSYVLEIDTSISQLYKLSAAWAQVMSITPKEVAERQLPLLLKSLLQEGSYDSYLHARNLYLVATDHKVFSATKLIALFKRISHYFLNNKVSPDEMIWMPPSLAGLYKLEKNSLLRKDKALSQLTEQLYCQLGDECLTHLWSAPWVFLSLAEHSRQELVLEMYQLSCTKEAFDPAKEATLTYLLMKRLLKSHNEENIALAFSLWLSGLNVNHPNKNYKEKVSALFLDWLCQAAAIPIGWQVVLCRVLDGNISASDGFKVSEKLIFQETLAEEVWPFLSNWLAATSNTSLISQGSKGCVLAKERLCLAIGQGQSRGLSLQAELHWLSLALREYATDIAHLTSWLFRAIERVDRQIADKKIVSVQLVEVLSLAKDRGFLEISVLTSGQIELLFRLYDLILENGIEAPVQHFLDNCDSDLSTFPQELLPVRKGLRRAWLASISSEKTISLKRLTFLEKQIEKIRGLADIEPEDIGHLYRSILGYLLQPLSPKKRLVHGAVLLKRAIEGDERAFLTVENLRTYIGALPVIDIAFEIVIHPQVLHLLGDLYITVAAPFIGRYGAVSRRAAEDVYRHLKTHYWEDQDLFDKHLPVYKAFLSGLTTTSDRFYYFSLSYDIAERAGSASDRLLPNDLLGCVAFTKLSCEIFRDIYEKRWSADQRALAREMIACRIKGAGEEPLYCTDESALLTIMGSSAGYSFSKLEQVYEAARFSKDPRVTELFGQFNSLAREVVKVLSLTKKTLPIIQATKMFYKWILDESDPSGMSNEDFSLLEGLFKAYTRIDPAQDMHEVMEIVDKNNIALILRLAEQIHNLIIPIVATIHKWSTDRQDSFNALWYKLLGFLLGCFESNYNPDIDFIDNSEKDRGECSDTESDKRCNPWRLLKLISSHFQCIQWSYSEGVKTDFSRELWCRLMKIYWTTPFSNPRNSEGHQVAKLLSAASQIFYDRMTLGRTSDLKCVKIDPLGLMPLCNAVKAQMLSNPCLTGCSLFAPLEPMQGCDLDALKKQLDLLSSSHTGVRVAVRALLNLKQCIAPFPFSLFNDRIKTGSKGPIRTNLSEQWLLFCVSIQRLLPGNKLTPELLEVFLMCQDWIIKNPEDNYFGLVLLCAHACTTVNPKPTGLEMKEIILSDDGSLDRGFQLITTALKMSMKQTYVTFTGEMEGFCKLLSQLWYHAHHKGDRQYMEECKNSMENVVAAIQSARAGFRLSSEEYLFCLDSLRQLLDSSPWTQKNGVAQAWAAEIKDKMAIGTLFNITRA